MTALLLAFVLGVLCGAAAIIVLATVIAGARRGAGERERET
jgi:hypothetical protein